MKRRSLLLIVGLAALAVAGPARADTVTSNADTGAGSLRDTVAAAAPGATIDFAPSVSEIVLATPITLNKNLTIDGPGAGALALSGGDASQVFVVTTAAVVTISDLTIRDGLVTGGGPGGGGAISMPNGNLTLDGVVMRDNNATMNGATADNGGGAINSNFGQITIRNSILRDNHATLTVLAESGGGAIFASANTTLVSITDSTLSGNTVSATPTFGKIRGGAIMGLIATVDLVRSTVTGNTVTATTGTGDGGGGGVASGGRVNLTNSTVSGNAAHVAGGNSGGGGIYTTAVGGDIVNSTIAGNSADGVGGGIYNASQLTPLVGFKNSILAGNTTAAPDNCGGPRAALNDSNGHNLEDGNTCGFEPPAGDLVNTNPFLGPLANNGGPTLTRALAAASPAIGRAAPADCPAVDQRGLPRKQVGTCDIGAWEFQVGAPFAATGGATGVGLRVATLNGSATPNKSAALVHFDFGRSAAYGGSTPAKPIGAGTLPVAATAALGSLAPKTKYHYRLVAANSAGTTLGADLTFTTPAVSLTGLKMAPKRWRLGSRLPRASRRARVGTRISFRLSAAAKVKLTFQRRRKVGGKVRYVKAGVVSVKGHAGLNRVRFQGRLSKKRKLKRGRYRLVATAVDGAKKRSLKFTIVR